MSAMASQISSISSVCSTASLAFVWGIHWWLVNSPHKRPVTQKMLPFDDVIISYGLCMKHSCSDTIWSHRNMANFHQYTQNTYPISHPLGLGMGCLFVISMSDLLLILPSIFSDQQHTMFPKWWSGHLPVQWPFYFIAGTTSRMELLVSERPSFSSLVQWPVWSLQTKIC